MLLTIARITGRTILVFEPCQRHVKIRNNLHIADQDRNLPKTHTSNLRTRIANQIRPATGISFEAKLLTLILFD